MPAGNGKPLRAMTFGQCLATLVEVAPILPGLLVVTHPSLNIRRALLTPEDKASWKRIVTLRNRMAHSGPGFFDSVDMHSGRIWRRCEVKEPLHQQAKEVWAIGRQLSRSAFILTCVALQGVEEETAKAKLFAAETKRWELQELGTVCVQAINKFHAA